MKLYLEKNLSANKLEAFIGFAVQISTSFSLSRYYNGTLSNEEFIRINEEHIKLINEANLQRREHFTNDSDYHKRILQFTKSEEGAQQYFNDLYMQDLECAQMVQCNGDDQPYMTNRTDFIRKEYTRDSQVTSGPIFEVCHYEIDKTWVEVKQQLTNLFTFPIWIDGTAFEDLAFYKDKQVKIAVCSHECFCWMELSDEEVEILQKLGIKYDK